MYEQYQQPEMGDYPMPNSTMQNMLPPQMADGLLQYQIDTDEIIDNIEHILRQEITLIDIASNSLQWKPNRLSSGETLQPLCSEEFINHIRLILKSRLTKVFILSDLDEGIILNLTKSVTQDLIKKVVLDWFGCGIKDTSTASMIIHMIDECVYATLCKAKDANYLVFLKTIAKLQENTVTGQSQNRQKEHNPLDPRELFGRKK